MSQGKTTPKEVKLLVRKLVYSDPSVSGKELEAEVKKVFPEYPSSIRNYQSIKKEIIDEVRELREGILEEQWHLGMLTYANSMLINSMPINPDSVERILKIQKIAKYPITLRRARWIAYLSPCIRKDEALRDISFGYACLELIADLSGELFNTSEYDIDLIDESRHKALLQKLTQALGNLDWMKQKKPISKLTGGVLESPIVKVLFKKRTAYGVLGNGKKFKWGPALTISTILKRKGLLGESVKDENGDVVINLTGLQLPTTRQLQKAE